MATDGVRQSRPPGAGGVSADDFDRALAKAREALRELRAGGSDVFDAEPVRGTGSARDGLVSAVAEGGRLSTLLIEPQAMRLASQELAARIVEAVNAALEDLAARAVTEAGAAVDPIALDARLAELQDQSLPAMARYTQAISDTMARLRRQG